MLKGGWPATEQCSGLAFSYRRWLTVEPSRKPTSVSPGLHDPDWMVVGVRSATEHDHGQAAKPVLDKGVRSEGAVERENGGPVACTSARAGT